MALISKLVKLGEASQVVVQMPKLQLTPDDNRVMQQIRSAHSPDSNLVVDEKALLTIATDILQNATAKAHVRAVSLWMPEEAERDATIVRQGISRNPLSTDLTAVTEVICSRTLSQIQNLKQAYSTKYNSDIESRINSFTSPVFGNHKKLLIACLEDKARDEGNEVDLKMAEEDAKQLYKDGEKRWGTNERTFISIFTKRNRRQLAAVDSAYNKFYGHSLEKAVEKETSGYFEDGLLTLLKCAKYFAEDPKANNEVLIEKVKQQGISEALAFTIHKIGCEMTCNCSGGEVKGITLAVFNTLVKYSWDAKVVLALSAFAVSYGEFCLISQLHATNPIAKSVVLLKPLPDISERESLISSLLKVVIDVTNCIIQLMELPSEYHDEPPLSDTFFQIPNVVYWAIRSIVACASQSIGLINIGHEYVISITEARKKLSDLSRMLMNIYNYLSNQLTLCHQHIEEQKSNQDYYNLINSSKVPTKTTWKFSRR